jgi:hypothetical protein
VPALVTDRGILTETPAMLVFVAQAIGGRARTDRRSVRLRRIRPSTATMLEPSHQPRPIACAASLVDADDAHSIAAMQQGAGGRGACFT